MRRKIQVTVDKELDAMVKVRAAQMGLSVSSFARLALINALPEKRNKFIDEALKDIASGDVDSLTLAEFKKQVDDL